MPSWPHLFPPSVETHYLDNILTYRYDRTCPEKTYCSRVFTAKPETIEICFDGQPVFIKHQNTVLLNRLPVPPCSTNQRHN